MKKINQKIVATLLLCLSVVACKKEEDKNNDKGTYIESGSAIVTNEGGFLNNNGSVSFINRDGVVSNYIYESANGGINLGDVVQSYTRVGDKGIICVNNSQKIEIVDARTFKHIATIIDTTASQHTSYVRYALGVTNTKAYVTNGNMDGEVVVINLTTNTISNSINVGKGPEQLAQVGNSVYVCNSGGWDVDSTVSVINTTTDAVSATINVGDIPTKIVKDAQNNIWVLCAGQSDYSAWPDITKLTPSKLVKINTTSNTIEKSFTLINSGSLSYELNLAIGDNGNKIYYSISDKVFALDITATTLPASSIISGRSFYGLAVSPITNQVWGLQVPNLSSGGYVFRFNASGSLIDSLQVGIGPNNVSFNQ